MTTPLKSIHPILRRHIGACSVALAVTMAPVMALGQAEGREISSDSIDRISQANVLPMLTQRVAAASCALSSDIRVDESHDVLEHSAKRFETIVHALQDGNPDLHIIGPESRASIITDIEHVWDEWAPVHDAVAAVLADGHDVENAHVIDDHNLKLLELTTTLVDDISSQYADPFILSQADTMMFNIMTRQGLLTQEMSKDACEIWSDYHADEAKEDLKKVMTVFESSLFALRDGMPAAGLLPAPTEEIRTDLVDLIGRWEVVKVNLTALVAGEEINTEAKEEIYHDLNVELDHIAILAKHYSEYSERHHGD